MSPRIAIIFGAGPGLGAAVASAFSPSHSLVLLSRSLPGSLPKLKLAVPDDQILALSSDGSLNSMQVAVEAMKKKWPSGVVDVGVYNMGGGYNPQSFLKYETKDLMSGLEGGVIYAFSFAQIMMPLLLKQGGSLIFTGATMSLRGGADFSAQAPGMFARRALSQSLAREFGPQGVHVSHVILDGLIDTPRIQDWAGEDKENTRLKPEDIAQQYVMLANQPKSAWTQELDLRPFCEKF
ncbi:hypothetical protein TREMEDRAFT_56366 [Tremella mesenterica DSM 1558]|uniref:uncharacterized protein n=1 Tax=Tremella mesenterica (strain ATCC 24925 / CBS 8224 / DSM 1558 / NBRC 9311 / NRRL Y-6157 / RJB 2259-6 / UBC 559-6) TaxID=578456 RepID=UPI0003F49657|nr:uncharacterized protein TREMEDRAFT_56366 [Tremella mesenterica DSM 1558]EIW71255.1 hypothetical protein TREMEDRAFT_56366 [Tremella mesenterica DSM 1558]